VTFRALAIIAALTAITTAACTPTNPQDAARASFEKLVAACKASGPQKPAFAVVNPSNTPGSWNKIGWHHFEYSYEAKASDSLLTPYVGTLTIRRFQQMPARLFDTREEAEAAPIERIWEPTRFEIQLAYRDNRWVTTGSKWARVNGDKVDWMPSPPEFKPNIDYGFAPQICAPT
jgi:hypothetical protein